MRLPSVLVYANVTGAIPFFIGFGLLTLFPGMDDSGLWRLVVIVTALLTTLCALLVLGSWGCVCWGEAAACLLVVSGITATHGQLNLSFVLMFLGLQILLFVWRRELRGY
jgi:hypothetical protein